VRREERQHGDLVDHERQLVGLDGRTAQALAGLDHEGTDRLAQLLPLQIQVRVHAHTFEHTEEARAGGVQTHVVDGQAASGQRGAGDQEGG
jgi:hypothetical protein